MRHPWAQAFAIVAGQALFAVMIGLLVVYAVPWLTHWGEPWSFSPVVAAAASDGEQASAHVSGGLYVIESVHGLEPGRRLEQTFQFTPTFSGFPRCFGGSAQAVNADGSLYAFDQLAFLDPAGETGTLRGWWREPGTGCYGDPVQLGDGPAELTIAVP